MVLFICWQLLPNIFFQLLLPSKLVDPTQYTRVTTSISLAKPDRVFLVKQFESIFLIQHNIFISGIDLNWRESIGGKVTKTSEPFLPDSAGVGMVEKSFLTITVNVYMMF